MNCETWNILQAVLNEQYPIELLQSEFFQNEKYPYKQEAIEEANRLFDSDSARHGRTKQQILGSCNSGKYGEIIIRECLEGNNRFISYHERNNKDVYHDVIDLNNEKIIEIKVWNTFEEDIIEEICTFLKYKCYLYDKKGYNHSNYLVVFKQFKTHFECMALIDVEHKKIIGQYAEKIMKKVK
jgi:hypothetical protein